MGYRYYENKPQYSFLGVLERVFKEKNEILMLSNIPKGLMAKKRVNRLKCFAGLYKNSTVTLICRTSYTLMKIQEFVTQRNKNF